MATIPDNTEGYDAASDTESVSWGKLRELVRKMVVSIKRVSPPESLALATPSSLDDALQVLDNVKVQRSTSVAALLALSGTAAARIADGAMFQCAGRDAAEDGGGGVFRVKANAGDETDNGVTKYILSDGRLLERLFEGAVNVKWAGAKGDGITDDTTALVAAAALGLSVRIPKGIYRVTALNQIQIGMGKQLLGEDSVATVIEYDGSMATGGYVVKALPNTTIQGLTIRAKDFAVAPQHAGLVIGIADFTGDAVRITDCKVFGFSVPIYVTRSRRVVISRCETAYARDFGVSLFDCAYSQIIDSHSHHNGLDGFKVQIADSAAAWQNGVVVEEGNKRQYGNNIYTADADGTTGMTPPTHTSGSVTDGAISWTFVQTREVDIQTDGFTMAFCLSEENGQRDNLAPEGWESTNGNGIDLYNGGFRYTIIGSIFRANYGYGVVAAKGGIETPTNVSGRFVGCQFRDGREFSGGLGGGVLLESRASTRLFFESCLFEENIGLGIQANTEPGPHEVIMDKCEFVRNGNGAGKFAGDNTIITGCVFIGNGRLAPGTSATQVQIGYSLDVTPDETVPLVKSIIRDSVFCSRYDPNHEGGLATLVAPDEVYTHVRYGADVRGVTIDNCSFYHNVYSAGAAAIIIQCLDAQIKNSYFYGIAGMCIETKSYTKNAGISECIFEECGASTPAIRLYGANAEVRRCKSLRQIATGVALIEVRAEARNIKLISNDTKGHNNATGGINVNASARGVYVESNVGFNGGIAELNIADLWVTATLYNVGDFAEESGLTYRCIVAHTSGTFATDLSNENWVRVDKTDEVKRAVDALAPANVAGKIDWCGGPICFNQTLSYSIAKIVEMTNGVHIVVDEARSVSTFWRITHIKVLEFTARNIASQNVQSLLGGVFDQEITILVDNTGLYNTVLKHNTGTFGKLYLSGASDFTATDYGSITLKNINGRWTEIHRSEWS